MTKIQPRDVYKLHRRPERTAVEISDGDDFFLARDDLNYRGPEYAFFSVTVKRTNVFGMAYGDLSFTSQIQPLARCISTARIIETRISTRSFSIGDWGLQFWGFEKDGGSEAALRVAKASR